MAHLIVISVGGTSMYSSMKSQQAILNDKVSRIEANMYTTNEANLRLEMQKAEIAALKEELKKIDNKDYIMKLVDNWKNLWKSLTVQVSAVGFAVTQLLFLMPSWDVIPQEVKDAIHLNTFHM